MTAPQATCACGYAHCVCTVGLSRCRRRLSLSTREGERSLTIARQIRAGNRLIDEAVRLFDGGYDPVAAQSLCARVGEAIDAAQRRGRVGDFADAHCAAEVVEYARTRAATGRTVTP